MSKKHHAISAGTSVTGTDKTVPDIVVECMAEIGIDILKSRRKQLTPEMIDAADIVVMVTAKEDWPDYVMTSGKARFWDVEDAKGRDYEFHCSRRDEIKEHIKNLLEEIEKF